MSRVTKAYKIEPRRSNLFNKEKRGVPSQSTSDGTSDRSSKSGSPTERESCSECDANKLSDSFQNFSIALGTVGEDSPGPVAHKCWNVGLGDSCISIYSTPESPTGFFCKDPIEHPVDSNGRPTLRIMIPTLPVSNRMLDDFPIAPTIPNDYYEPSWDHEQERLSES